MRVAFGRVVEAVRWASPLRGGILWMASMPHPLPSGLDLDACLFGGQAFTWWKRGGTLHGIAKGARVRIDPTTRRWRSVPEKDASFLSRYFGADRARPEDLLGDGDLAPLARALPGLRLLDQDPWEAFLAFLLTPVNNVPRIQETIARLCQRLGPSVDGAKAIPPVSSIAGSSEAELRDLGLGFRAPRVRQAAREIHEGELVLGDLQDAGFEAARARLLEVSGVGPKVAECILCYALGFDEAFPVDRWVARASKSVLGEKMSPKQARKRWGPRAAMAQQVLFHAARTGVVEGLEASAVSGFEGWRSLVGAPEAYRGDRMK